MDMEYSFLFGIGIGILGKDILLLYVLRGDKKIYHSIGIGIGIIIEVVMLFIMLFNMEVLEIYLPYFFICLTPIIGCYYGWLLENSKRAFIIGGILGLLFGLNPLASSIFILFSPIIHSIKFKFYKYFFDSEYFLKYRSYKYRLCLFFPILTGIVHIATIPLLYQSLDFFSMVFYTIIYSLICGLLFIPIFNYFAVLILFLIGLQKLKGLLYIIIILINLPLAGLAIGEIIGSIKEYDKKMEEFKSKVEKWKKEGYDVSELEEMLK